MEYHKVSSPTLSKKLTNSVSFSGKSIYDGVFSGQGKVVSTVEEDYSEIFGGSGGCSIPILDVPELNERRISVDINSSKLDYSKIFGGFGEFDFGVSDEELPVKPNKRDRCIEEARTPAKIGAHRSNFSVENQVSSQEATNESLDGVKQSKVFYHKTQEGRRNGINGTKNLAPCHDVAGYTRLIDEVAPSQMNGGDKPFLLVPNKVSHNRSFSGEIMEGRSGRKVVSTCSLGGGREQASGDGAKSKYKSNRSRSYSIDVPFDAYEIGLRKSSSKVSLSSTCPLTGYNKGDPKVSMTSKFGFSDGHSSEDAADICSPTYFDMEVDVNSVAASSAAAVKKAIEEAQARIRIAKEIMERKKEGFQNHVKLRPNNVSKTKEKTESTTTDKANKFVEDEWEKFKVDNQMPVVREGTQNAKSSQVAQNFTEKDNLSYAKGVSHETHEHKRKITPVDHKWEEVIDWIESVNECELKEESSTMRSFEKPEEIGEKLEVSEEAHKQEEFERTLNIVEGACEMKECADKPKFGEVHDQEENGKKLQDAGLAEEMDVIFKEFHEVEASEIKLRKFQEPTVNEKNLKMQESKYDECMKMRTLNSEQEWLETEQKQKEIFKQEQNDAQSEDFPGRKEVEAGSKEIFNHKENGIEEEEAAGDWVAFEKQQKEAFSAEENVGKRDVHCGEEAEKVYDEAENLEKIEVTMYAVHDSEKCNKKSDEDGEVVKEKIVEAEENEKIMKEVVEMMEMRIQKEGGACTESGQMRAGIDHKAEDEKIRATQETLNNCNNNLEAVINVSKQEKIGILSDTLGTSSHEENAVSLERPRHEENGELMEVSPASSECKEMETESNSAEVAKEMGTTEVSEVEIPGLEQGVLEHEDTKKQVKDRTEAVAFNYNKENVGNTDMDVPQKQNDPHGEASVTVCNGGKHVEELPCESEEIFEDAEEVDVAIEQEEDEGDFEFSSESWVDSEKNSDRSRLPSIFQAGEETAEIYNGMKTSQITERIEETYSKTTEAEHSMQKEGEIEKENMRKIDKIKEKEREKEKERIAVERAVREARERAFIEARERAERAAVEKANAEARRRAMAEARGRLEKASAEANDKTSMEARLKAERAAVERATAEARARALEKVMSEKVAVVARNQTVKSSGASRDNGIRQNFTSDDSQYRSSTGGSGHLTSNSSVPYSNDKVVGVNGESIQKDKASLERDKRTAERAAKALAEKNMRDLLAKKEQAERNRLAQALDANVKRWSSGKAGNLRALLSTLQYILGPDSGWQPIPLTDLVATAAVKKAYRKATLFVHPDKLQQRGASIEQKYTCEKVFDLLKDAWNKFSAEER